MPPRPTIQDVARIAGVSTATVSRSIHFPDRVMPRTRDAVEQAIRATGYTLNAAAQNLRQRRAQTVLVVMPNIGNIFFSEILAGIEQTAAVAGLVLLIGDTASDPVREQAYIRQMLNGRADGAILLAEPLAAWFALPLTRHDGPLPVVAVSEPVPGGMIPHVGIDNMAAATAATGHLIALGHRRIAHLTGPAGNGLTALRIAGFHAALHAAGLPIGDAPLLPGDFSAAAGLAAASALLALPARPTAVFCANDEMAMGLAQGLHRRGVQVPGDISIIGFDDIHFADTFIPALSTIRQPRRAMGEAAMRLLLAILEGAPDPGSVLLPHVLVRRDSTAPPHT